MFQKYWAKYDTFAKNRFMDYLNPANRSKDENHIYNPWRLDEIVLDDITFIEENCGEMMEIFGYIPTGGNVQKINDTENFKTVIPSIFCTL